MSIFTAQFEDEVQEGLEELAMDYKANKSHSKPEQEADLIHAIAVILEKAEENLGSAAFIDDFEFDMNPENYVNEFKELLN